MKNILGEKFFSIEYFNDYGLEEVSNITGVDVEVLLYEQRLDNFYVGQTERGSFYFFCECSEDLHKNEITFNHFKSLLDKTIT